MSEQEYIDSYIGNILRGQSNNKRFDKSELKTLLARVLDDKSGLYVGKIKELDAENRQLKADLRKLTEMKESEIKMLVKMLTNILDGHLPPCVLLIKGDDD